MRLGQINKTISESTEDTNKNLAQLHEAMQNKNNHQRGKKKIP